MAADASARWATLQTLLERALDLPEAERAAFVAEHAAGDPDLGQELADLLRAADAVPAFLDAPPAWSLSEDAAEPDLAGRQIGPYRIVRELGRGGQGRVFLAERDDVGSRVALKILRGGLAAPDLFRRFLTERRVLAGLDHPHIARLLDAGTLDDGVGQTPYFVMEAVEGQPITTYTHERDLSLHDRLALFGQVCDAVAFAHRRLVVHRDLKPSNVLVTDEGRVKLLDFGIAKLLDDSPDEALTQTGRRLLTPEYAAPEQVLDQDVTVATDVYALGVLLYELLADTRPYDTSGGLRAVVRAVCDEMPPPPSAKAPADRARALRGDLDAIVLRALAKAPEARYRSVEALTDDLARQRDGRPVRARSQTAWYRASRYVRRHAVGVGLGVLVGALAVAFVVRERALRVDAETARTEAEATTSLLVDLFGATGDGEGDEFRPDTLRAFALVDRAARRLDARTDYDPALKAALTLRIGDLFEGIQRPAESLDRYREAERLARLSDRSPPALADALLRIGFRLTTANRCTEALTILDEATRLYRASGADGRVLSDALGGRGSALACLQRYDDAIVTTREAQALLDGRDDDGGFILHMLADFLDRAGRSAEAEATLRTSIARGEALYPRGHSVITARRDMLSHMLAAHGDLAGAEREARRSYEDIVERHGAVHRRTIGAQIQLARVLRQRGKLEDADTLTAALVRAADRLPPTDVVDRTRAHEQRARVLFDLGRFGEAETEARTALAAPRPAEDSYLIYRATLYRTLRDILAAAGRPEAAAEAEREAVRIEREAEAARARPAS